VDAPIFIVGANRSGTTLLRLILNAHPRIAIPDELIYFRSSLAGTPIEQWRTPDLSPPEYEAFVDRFLDATDRPLDALDHSQLKDDILDGPPTFRRPYRCALEAWARHHGKDRWGEKTPGNLFYADVILDMFPEARFLYMVRDPRAGVASMQRVSFFPDDVIFNALSRRKHDTKGRALLKRAVPDTQRMTVRYEDLVRNPAPETRAVCRFLGEDFSPEMLQFHRNADDYMKDEAEEQYNATATRPITDDRVDAWRNRLAPNQVAAVESICHGVMQRFRYEPTGHSLPLATRGEMLVKKAYWALQCWRHRDVRHYTVKSQFLERSANRLRALIQWLRDRARTVSPFHPQ
jgi:hypothetical protein